MMGDEGNDEGNEEIEGEVETPKEWSFLAGIEDEREPLMAKGCCIGLEEMFLQRARHMLSIASEVGKLDSSFLTGVIVDRRMGRNTAKGKG